MRIVKPHFEWEEFLYLHVVLKGAIYANYNNLFLFSANLTIGLSNPIFPTDDVVSVGKIIINMK